MFLPSFTSAALLGADANSHVLLCGGHTGLVRLYQVSYVVSCTSSKEKTGRGSKRRVRTGAQADDDTGVFACCALFTLAMSGPRVVVSLLATAQGVRDSAEQSRYQKPLGTQLSTSIACLLLQKNSTPSGSCHITAMTSDQTFITYELSVISKDHSTTLATKRKTKRERKKLSIKVLTMLCSSASKGNGWQDTTMYWTSHWHLSRRETKSSCVISNGAS